MYPSTPPEAGRDAWSDDPPPGAAGPPHGPGRRGYPAGPAPDPGPGGRETEPAGREPDDDAEFEDEIEVVPLRRRLSAAIAGFAVLVGVGLILGAQTAGPGAARIPFAVVVFGVQVLFVLAWTMATRPPALPWVAGVAVAVAAAADMFAVDRQEAGLSPLLYVGVGGAAVALLGQLVRSADRARMTDSIGSTLLVTFGVVALGTLLVLGRVPAGTQAIFVAATAAAVALLVARLMDAVFLWPRLAPQVPRGAAGIVVGAMCGTLASAVLGSYLVSFTPASGAVIGLVAAGAAVLADLGAGYAEAGRQMAGEPPTLWLARHLQGPLGGFALAAPAAYAMTVLYL
ncbi:hypothetical protein [Polymorphospora rubra]|uniref:CDP-diglyceride synthetase n=1 Tax=Polymorphospora rubra TaxID=338584 RepID=A0A810N0A4_9ACTN|nr:hypothetical protein [Polymorphospora rubra]BCJ66104.1 hypothetical protein Prubr_31250 [Polymorphospora rubra]